MGRVYRRVMKRGKTIIIPGEDPPVDPRTGLVIHDLTMTSQEKDEIPTTMVGHTNPGSPPRAPAEATDGNEVEADEMVIESATTNTGDGVAVGEAHRRHREPLRRSVGAILSPVNPSTNGNERPPSGINARESPRRTHDKGDR